MKLTILLAIIFILSVCLLLYAAVALIQDKRFFTTAPEDIQEAALEHPERFPGAHIMGWELAAISLLAMIFVFLYGGYDGIKRGFGFWQLTARFTIILYIWKAFDIICLDWYLLTRSHFFQHYYPETEGCKGYDSFGFNRKEQIARLILFPFLAMAMAFVCILFKR
ncbi:MAG: hypothetical protein IKF80_09315 [Erysipelotrichaceae bacterium]|nr:hypothetical protein [Erysipelotrichaceae bacterium]